MENKTQKLFIEDGEMINNIYVGDLVDEDDNVILEKSYFEDNNIDIREYIESKK
jgi:hypothetical protein